jgi:elongation factor Ts
MDAFMACPMNGNTVDAELKEMIHVIGENMKVNRFARVAAANGTLAAYVHHDGKHADIVEYSLEKDETANNSVFKTFAHDVAMQVIASDPISARREDIPEDVIEHEKEIYRAQAADSGRPEKFWDGIVNGRLKKFFQERALKEQVFVKDGNMTVAELVDKVSADTDDKIDIIRFVRFNFGE